VQNVKPLKSVFYYVCAAFCIPLLLGIQNVQQTFFFIFLIMLTNRKKEIWHTQSSCELQ